MDQQRRDWLRLGIALAVAGVAPAARASKHLPPLSESDAQARQLNYRHDAESIDDGRFPNRRKQRQTCGNCQFFYAENDGWGECTVFPKKLVNQAGWCSAWAANMG